MLDIPKEISETFKQIGLDRAESQVYFALLRNGIMGIQEITNVVKLPRSSIHLACENLLKSGVIKTSAKGKRRSFYLEKPKDIENIIQYEENIINKNKSLINSIIPKLNTIYAFSQEIEPIEIEELRGEDGFIETYYRALNQPANSEILRIGGDTRLFVSQKEKLKKYGQVRMKKKIYTKLLLPDYELSKREIEEAKFKMREVHILNKEIFDPKIQMSIWQENTAFTIWDKGLHSIIIKNKSISDALKQLYKIAWDKGISEV